MRIARLALAAALLATLCVYVACTLGAIDFTGKTCTGFCPSPLACVNGHCERDDAAPPSALVQVTDLHAEWATPNSIRWAWQLVGDASDVAYYELALTSENNPDAGGVKTWTSADNPELAGGIIEQASGLGLVSGTITDTLDPTTTYQATVTAVDKVNARATAGPALQSTDSSGIEQLTIFRDAPANGASLLPGPPSETVDDDGGCGAPQSPAACIHFKIALDDGGTAGTDNVRIYNAPLGLTAASSFQLQHAYLELYVRGIGGSPKSQYSRVALRVWPDPCPTDPTGAACTFEYADWVYGSPAQYRRVQIPLSALRNKVDSSVMTPADLAQSAVEFTVYAHFDPTEELFIDEVGIWY